MSTVIATIPVGRAPCDIALGQRSAAFDVRGDRVIDAYIHAYVTNNIDGTVSAIDTATNTVIATIPVGYCTAPAVSPDGARAYVSVAAGLLVIDTYTNTVVGTIPVGVAGVAISPDSTHAYAYCDPGASNEGIVSVIDLTTNTVTTTIPVGDSAGNSSGCVAVSPDGTRVYVTRYNDGTMSVIDLTTNTVSTTIPLPVGSPIGVGLSPDGTRAYITIDGAGTASVLVVDTATNTVATIIAVGGGFVLGMGVSPDGTRVYVAVTDPVTNTKFDGTVSVIDTATSTVITTVPVGGFVTGVAVSPDSTRVYVTHYNDNGDHSGAGKVSVIAVADGLFDNSRSSQLIAELIGAVERDGGGWLVIGDHVVPIPPRSPFLFSIAAAASPHLGQAIENRELADQIRQLLQARSR